MTNKMKAVVLYRTGGPEELRVEVIDSPHPGPGEVTIDVVFAGCNWADIQIRQGLYPHTQELPFIPGFEVAGVVTELGEGADPSLLGRRVAAIVPGAGYAQKVLSSVEGLIMVPDAMTFEQAAAFPIQALTAYHMLHTVFQIKEGDIILCHAIGGGLGQYVTAIGRSRGARVFGTVGTPGKEAAPLALGAEYVVQTRTEDFVQTVLDMTGGYGVDLVIDSLGASTLDRSFELLRPLGHVISIGEAEGLPFSNLRERLLPKSLTFTRFHLGHVDVSSVAWQTGVDKVTTMISDGSLTVPVQRTYAIDKAAEMHRALEGRGVAGKLLLDPAG